MDAGPSPPPHTARKAGMSEGGRGDDATASDSPLRRLRRENHLLRLQLLKLREQQRSLLQQVAVAGLTCLHDEATMHATAGGELSPGPASPTERGDGPSLHTAPDGVKDEATALRALMLQRREARHQRTTSARALLQGVEQRDDDPAAAAAALQDDESVATTTATAPSDMSDDPAPVSRAGGAADTGASALYTAATPPSSSLTGAATRGGKSTAQDDMSAQTMLQRFHDRKAQRRLRLEQMLGNVEDASVDTTPFGNAPRHAAGGAGGEEELTSRLDGSGNSTATAGNGSGDGDGAAEEAFAGAVAHRTARGGGESTSAAAAAAAPAGPTQNPNQIGRVVSDATKNNSWYLCKVLEAALLDTIQARHGGVGWSEAVTPAQTPTHAFFSTPPATAEGESSSSSAARTAAAAPQFLYQVGVSENALRRAIEESLVLPFRCIRDAPQRLTSQQAADEAVPLFEAENKDGELRRCFAGQGMRDSAERGGAAAHAEATEANNASDEEKDSSGPSVLGADDDTLDPFARLLLARLSAELPTANAKGDKKRKDHRSNGKQREEFLQGLYTASGGEGGLPGGGASFATGAATLNSSSSKPNAAFVMAAAGGDGKVHIPKKHFSRLDEVQVEMHAPVIFNQIRGFLRLDIDRFRRSFARGEVGGDGGGGGGGGDGAVPDGPRLRLSQQLQQQQQQRRLRGGAGGGAEGATSWRISVSPGKSGTTLLYFGDYVMKTVKPSELEFFVRKFLPAYVRYCERNPHTLLPRFYALVTVRWWKAGMAQHFVLMHNVFATPYYIHRIYDVKGSTVNRTALQPGKPPPRTAFGALLLKDNDLPAQLIICGAYQRAILLAQLRSDVGFLRQLCIVDYSCMIGVRSRLFSREEGPSKTIVLQRHQHHDNGEPYVDPLSGGEASVPLARHSRTRSEITNVTSAAAEAGEQTVRVSLTGASPAMPLAGARPASDDDVYVCIHGCDGGLLSLPIYAPGDDTTAREDVYFLGIIDVLQTYNSAKKLESFAKGFVNDRQAISVIPPDGYSERLYKVLERITV